MMDHRRVAKILQRSAQQALGGAPCQMYQESPGAKKQATRKIIARPEDLSEK
jgi:hypothetical protein